ncbi:MAG: signal peptidase I [Clostridium sp.]|nr:signal peptidase I [Clostridium sp.]
MKKKLRLIIQIIAALLAVLLAGVVAFNVYSAICREKGKPLPKLFGGAAAIVTSGSMSPELEVNDLIILRQQDAYQVGDVIVFRSPTGTGLVTHRLIEITDEGFFRTKGDFNNTADPVLLLPSSVEGKVVKVFPGLGRFQEFLHSPLGMLITGVIVIAIVFLPGFGGKKKKSEPSEEI